MSVLAVQKAAGALGAYVSGVDLKDVVGSADLVEQVRRLAVEHQVLFFREQPVSPRVFQEFAQQFGEVMDHPAYAAMPDAPAVQVLESTAAEPSKIEVWHSDMTFNARPPSFTLLYSKVVPAYGGDTLWASAVEAYASLSEPMQAMFDPLVAVHDFAHGFKESLAEPGGAQRLASALAANPPVRHPLIRTHPETGRKGIYVNALFTTHIEDLSPLESQSLLRFLYQHIVTEEFTVRLAWQPDTLALWDNRSTQHKPVNDYFPQHRLMHRVTIQGDRPV